MRRIIYIHVPKCGGSSFGAALRARAFLSQATVPLNLGLPELTGEARIISDYDARARHLRTLVRKRVRMISGHVRYDPWLHQSQATDYAFVTLLRDPVERLVSHYHYLQRAHPDPKRASTLDAFLDTADAARLASQFCFYFGGATQTVEPDTRATVSRAIANLARFDLVGDLAAPDAFWRDLKAVAGARLPQWKRNAAPVRTDVPRRLRARIEALCAPDLEIYHSTLSRKAAA